MALFEMDMVNINRKNYIISNMEGGAPSPMDPMGGMSGLYANKAARPLLIIYGIFMVLLGLMVWWIPDFLQTFVGLVFIFQGIFMIIGFFTVKPQ